MGRVLDGLVFQCENMIVLFYYSCFIDRGTEEPMETKETQDVKATE